MMDPTIITRTNTTPAEHEEQVQEFISMNDPCPHVSRMQIIAAKLGNSEDLQDLLAHVHTCAS